MGEDAPQESRKNDLKIEKNIGPVKGKKTKQNPRNRSLLIGVGRSSCF